MLAEIIIINAETWANSMIESSTNLIPWLKTLDIRDNHSIHVPIPSICAPVTYQWRSGDFSCDCYCICSRCQQHINSASFCFQRIYNYANKRNKQDDLLLHHTPESLGFNQGMDQLFNPSCQLHRNNDKIQVAHLKILQSNFHYRNGEGVSLLVYHVPCFIWAKGRSRSKYQFIFAWYSIDDTILLWVWWSLLLRTTY